MSLVSEIKRDKVDCIARTADKRNEEQRSSNQGFNTLENHSFRCTSNPS